MRGDCIACDALLNQFLRFLNVSDAEASFLDLHLSILDGFGKTKIYDK